MFCHLGHAVAAFADPYQLDIHSARLEVSMATSEHSTNPAHHVYAQTWALSEVWILAQAVTATKTPRNDA